MPPPLPLPLWQLLTSPAHSALIADAALIDPTDVAAIERLRAHHNAPPDLAHAALQLATARRKLQSKWPDHAAKLIADPDGAEMASSEPAARHKAARFAQVFAPATPVVDLCCGLGADALALTDAGLAVTAIDIDPTRAWMAALNARCPSLANDAAAADLPQGPFHLDPARRAASRRLWHIDDHQPGPPIWRNIIEQRRDWGGGAIKLGPGLDIAAATRILPPDTPHEIEILSERGRLTQAILWIGALARAQHGTRTATLITPNLTTSFSATPDDFAQPDPPIAPLARYLIEADPAIERAGLLAAACRTTPMHALAPNLGLLTDDEPNPGPMFTNFQVQAHMPWIEKHIRTWLRDHHAGIVEVKTRARAVNPDALQRRLRGEGDQPYTLFVLRIGPAIEAIITQRPAI